MAVNLKDTTKVMGISLLLAVLITCASIAVLALLAYVLHFNDSKINIGTVVIDIIACLAGGFVAGRGMKERKFLWGMLLGALYFIVLFILSVVVSGSTDGSTTGYITTVLLCLGSGMLGGMLG